VRHHQSGRREKEEALKRASLVFLIAIMCLAQHSRDDYREAYRAWREADPNLERDAAAGGDPIAQRADRMAAEAAKCAAARSAFLEGFAQDEAQQVAWLESADPGPQPPFKAAKSDSLLVAADTAAVTRTIDTFATDPDRGIQQLRQALARERTALDALVLAIAERRKSADAESVAAQAIGQARTKALDQIRVMLEAAREGPTGAAREAAAWAEYYRKLGEGAKGEAAPLTVVPPGVPTATINSPVAAPPTITSVPLTRYVGAWTYPQSNGLFHGPQPEFIDVLVHEENGEAKGTVFARFKLPPGSTGDPIVRLDFSGKFQPTRNQVFNLVTSDGAKGTLELIPGPAFNLLEVNFQTEPRPGKVRQADVVLVKK
jgi:hypothetical protein